MRAPRRRRSLRLAATAPVPRPRRRLALASALYVTGLTSDGVCRGTGRDMDPATMANGRRCDIAAETARRQCTRRRPGGALSYRHAFLAARSLATNHAGSAAN